MRDQILHTYVPSHPSSSPLLLTSSPNSFLTLSVPLHPNRKMAVQNKDSIAISAYSTSSTMTSLKENFNPLDTIQYHDDKSPHVWSRIRHKNQNAFSEFFGTFIFLLFSFGCTAQYVLAEGKKGDYTTLCLGWGYVYSFISLQSSTLSLVTFVEFIVCSFLLRRSC